MWKSNCLSNNGRVKNNFQTILKESYYGLKHCRKKGEVKLKFEGSKEGSINRRKHNSLNGMEAKTTAKTLRTNSGLLQLLPKKKFNQ